jgi:hypothetical protein
MPVVDGSRAGHKAVSRAASVFVQGMYNAGDGQVLGSSWVQVTWR